MITPKTKDEIEYMTEGGRRLGAILEDLLELAKPGVTLIDIEAAAVRAIKQAGGTPSFTTVPGYRWATCLCVNEVVVHGIPTGYALCDGDVLTIDIGMVYGGLHTDTAWTKIVRSQASRAEGQSENEKERFLEIGQEALWRAIDQAHAGNRVGHISKAIQDIVEGAGFSVVKSLVGHGVGRELHEEPQVPGLLRVPMEQTPELSSGMTIAIEVIYAMGKSAVVYDNDDGWTIATRDRSLSSVFEHTVLITQSTPMVLTKAKK